LRGQAVLVLVGCSKRACSEPPICHLGVSVGVEKSGREIRGAVIALGHAPLVTYVNWVW